MPPILRGALPLLALLPAASGARAQATAAHLTVYEAGIAEVLEERAVALQPGLNRIEWRSLMPKAILRTLRVTAEGAQVVQQDVTFDGAEVRGERSPVLHLTLRNGGTARTARVQVDYLAPNLSWRNDYSLVLGPGAGGAPPAAAALDAWVSLYNQTGMDVRAGTVDLVAGEIALLVGDAQVRAEEYARNTAQMAALADQAGPALDPGEAGGLSAFSRFRLGRDLALNSNAPVVRHPLFQGAPVAIVQRHVFENEHGQQTLARGGFVLQPRGLEVRLVSKNPTDAAMPAGQVTIYARQGQVAQVVGQDRVPLTPPGGEFTVRQGRSSTLFGTRRVLERRQVEYRNEQGNTRSMLITRVEVVLTNRGARAAEAFVREGVEPFAENRWRVVESTVAAERLAASSLQMRVEVPAGGTTTLTYTLETR